MAGEQIKLIPLIFESVYLIIWKCPQKGNKICVGFSINSRNQENLFYVYTSNTIVNELHGHFSSEEIPTWCHKLGYHINVHVLNLDPSWKLQTEKSSQHVFTQ